MSTKIVSGILKDAAGVPIPNATLRFLATSTRSTVNTIYTDYAVGSDGTYTCPVNFGTYTLQVRRYTENQFRTICANVYIGEPSQQTLEELIAAQVGIIEPAPVHSHANATSSVPGFMSTTDKQKLDALGDDFYTKTELASVLTTRAMQLALSDFVSIKDFGTIGDGTLHTLQEWVDSGKFSGLAAIQVVYPKVTSLTQSIDWAAVQTCVDVNKGGECIAPKGQYVMTDTVVVPTGTTLNGQGKFDIWGDDTTKGTCFLTSGPGTPKRWTDIDGNDSADDTPIFVAGGPGVYFETMALRSDSWSMGILYPGVKQCGFRKILALGFTDACIYLDATWSSRNTTLKTLHPYIDSDDGMNEFYGNDFYLRATGAGAFAIKVQGTTRLGDSVASADLWQWGWGGTSDIRFGGSGRLSATGANGGCYSHDVQLFGVNNFGQGCSFAHTSFRLAGSAKYYCKLDRSKRHNFFESYGETTGTEIPVVSITSRTKAGGAEISFLIDDINGQLEIDGVLQGSFATRDWQDSRVISRIGADGRISVPCFHGVGSVNSSVPTQITTFHVDGLGSIGWDNGTTRVPLFSWGKTFWRPAEPLGAACGTTGYPWSLVNTARVTYTGDLTIDPTGVLNIGGSSINSVFVLGDTVNPIFRPLVDAGASIGTVSFQWQNGRFHNLYSDSGMVSVSDERLKTFADIITAEKAAALEIKANIRKFQFNNMIVKKGVNGARWHYGVGAQQVGNILRSHGIDPALTGFWCYDEWSDAPATYDDFGNELSPRVEAGNQYGINYIELCMFILAAI